MAIGSFKPGRKTIYLDQSTLSDAYGATTEGHENVDLAYAPLRDWIGRVAVEANLCVSLAHILETSRFPARRIVDAERIAAWLESLPLLWMRSATSVQEEEDEHWLKISAGIKNVTPVDVFASTPFDSFHERDQFAAAGAVAAANAGSILPFLDDARTLGWDRWGEGMRDVARRAIASYAASEGVHKSQVEKARRAQHRVLLRTRAFEALARMTERNDPDASRVTRHHADHFVATYQSNSGALPAERISLAYTLRIVEKYGKRDKGKVDEWDGLGDFFDCQHLSVAAAYCDVFTCDGPTAAAIRKARENLGLGPPLTRRNHPGGTPGFVADLMATWP